MICRYECPLNLRINLQGFRLTFFLRFHSLIMPRTRTFRLPFRVEGSLLVKRRRQMHSFMQYIFWFLSRHSTELPCRNQTVSSWCRSTIMNRWQRRAASEDHVMVSDSVKARVGRCRWRRIKYVFDTKALSRVRLPGNAFYPWARLFTPCCPSFPKSFMGFIRT